MLCTEPHGKGSTSQAKVLQGKQECSADWASGKQSNTTYKPTAELLEELKKVGQLQSCWQEWNGLTQDPWVFETIDGYKIPFSSPPPSTEIPPFSFSKWEQRVISQEIQSILGKRAIRVAKPGLGFVNNILFQKVDRGGDLS